MASDRVLSVEGRKEAVHLRIIIEHHAGSFEKVFRENREKFGVTDRGIRIDPGSSLSFDPTRKIVECF